MEDINSKIQRILLGDQSAFAELYNQTIHSVYRSVFFLTDDKQDLDDIVQDIYVELYKSLPRFDQTRSFQAWLYGITIRQHQAYRRKKWRQTRNDAIERELIAASSEADFTPSLIDKVANQDLLYQINRLSYISKQIIILRYLNDLTQDEIAEVLLIPLGTVKSRLHSALKQLRKRARREIHV